jgi:uncharacterized repeat protein (TIGR03803 family)
MQRPSILSSMITLLIVLGGCSGLSPSLSDFGDRSTVQVNFLAESNSGFNVIYAFKGAPNGAQPVAPLTAVQQVLYGTTESGGRKLAGTVFSLTKSGTPTTLHSFVPKLGAMPNGPVTSLSGDLFGTTEVGGTKNLGVVWTLTKSKAFSVLHNFTGGKDGAQPHAGLTVFKGILYGTTSSGGPDGGGVVFRITKSGKETTLHAFAGGTDGSEPYSGLTVLNGILYGTTFAGGTRDRGVVYSITADGTERVLYMFKGGTKDGAAPASALISSDDVLYGTTIGGGHVSSLCDYGGCGTVFSVTVAGTEKMLYSFKSGLDGAEPSSNLVEFAGALYGTTAYGGGNCNAEGCGTVYSVTSPGAETIVHRFTGSDGENPEAGLTPVANNLYGVTSIAGKFNHGTAFVLSASP